MDDNKSIDGDAKRRIKKLAAENKRLTREKEQLKKELDELQGKSPKKVHSDKYHSLLEQRAESEYMYSKRV